MIKKSIISKVEPFLTVYSFSQKSPYIGQEEKHMNLKSYVQRSNGSDDENMEILFETNSSRVEEVPEFFEQAIATAGAEKDYDFDGDLILVQDIIDNGNRFIFKSSKSHNGAELICVVSGVNPDSAECEMIRNLIGH